jgi:hypothetical protein
LSAGSLPVFLIRPKGRGRVRLGKRLDIGPEESPYIPGGPTQDTANAPEDTVAAAAIREWFPNLKKARVLSS